MPPVTIHMGKRRPAPRKSKRSEPEFVHQFLIVLSGTDPLVWRRIQVPLTYSFWDLHVAIQDAMGWLDYHLHEYRLLDGKDKIRAIGIPTGEEPPDERPPVPGWGRRVLRFGHGCAGRGVSRDRRCNGTGRLTERGSGSGRAAWPTLDWTGTNA